MVGHLLLLLVVGAAMLPLATTTASADDGPPRLLSTAGPLRPFETIERVVSLSTQTALITVRGYASTPADRAYWQPLYDATPEMLHLDFGSDLGRYDTRGDLSTSGDELRRAIQREVREEDVDSVRIVMVSQGGRVGGEAVRSGLSARDNVTDMVMLASPMNGSTTAQVVRGADLVATFFGGHRELAALLAPLGAGLDDPAMKQLPAGSDFEAPLGVRATMFKNVWDELVSDRDVRARGVPIIRSLVPTLLAFGAPAHGGQLADPRERAMVVAAVRRETVRESPVERGLAEALAPIVDVLRLDLLARLAIAFVAAAVLLSLARRSIDLVTWRRV